MGYSDYFLLVYSAVLALATASILLFDAVLIYGWRRTFSQISFYSLIKGLTICNTLHVVFQWGLLYPLFLLDDVGFYDWLDDSKIATIVLDATDQTLFIFIVLICLNRFGVFVYAPLLKLFDKKAMPFTVGASLASVVLLVASRTVLGAQAEISRATRTMKDASNFLDSSKVVINIIQYIVPVIVLAMYVWIYAVIRKTRVVETTTATQRAADKAVLVQAVIEAVALEVFRLVQLFPESSSDDSLEGTIINLIQVLASSITHCLNAIFFLTTNSTVRGVLFTLPLIRTCTRKHKLASITSY